MTQDEFDNFSLNLLEKDFFANEKKTMQIKGYFFDDMMQEIDIIIKNKFISKKARLSKISNIKSRMVCNITETSSIREIRNLQAKSISDTLVHLSSC